MKPSAFRHHVMDVMEELATFTWLTRNASGHLTDRCSKREEGAVGIEVRVGLSRARGAAARRRRVQSSRRFGPGRRADPGPGPRQSRWMKGAARAIARSRRGALAAEPDGRAVAGLTSLLEAPRLAWTPGLGSGDGLP